MFNDEKPGPALTTDEDHSHMRGVEYWNPKLPQETPDGQLCDLYGNPYPEAVQQLRTCVLPTPEKSADALIREAMNAYRRDVTSAPKSYVCTHCRDGASLPEGYVCQRCGTDNPRY